VLKRLETEWNPARMDALLLLHPIDQAIGREARDRGDYFLDDVGARGRKARHRGDEAGAPYLFASISVCDSRLFRGAPDGPFSLLRLWNRAEAAGHLYGLCMTASGSMSARRRRWPRPSGAGMKGILLDRHRPPLRR
jgi:MurNAc alpha-1-phosphate uridylyltransferase